jgi:hypothetical protein
MSEQKQGLIYLRNDANTEINFPVKRENITTERNFKINEQEMYSNDGKHHSTNFYHNGDNGLSFSVTGLFLNTDTTVMQVLDNWYTNMTPFTIVFGKHINLKLPLVSNKWIITKLSLKQEMDTVTEWDLTFKTYNPPKQVTAIKNNLVNRTTKSYKWQKNCKKTYKDLTYKKMKKKKGNNCAKLLNQILIELGYMSKSVKKVKTKKKDKKGKPIYKKTKYVPDKCTKKTSKAVKKFKKKWNEHKLKPKIAMNKKGKPTDTIDKNTYTALGNYKQLKNAKKKK